MRLQDAEEFLQRPARGSGLDRAHDHYGPDTSKENDHGNLDNAPSASDYTRGG